MGLEKRKYVNWHIEIDKFSVSARQELWHLIFDCSRTLFQNQRAFDSCVIKVYSIFYAWPVHSTTDHLDVMAHSVKVKLQTEFSRSIKLKLCAMFECVYKQIAGNCFSWMWNVYKGDKFFFSSSSSFNKLVIGSRVNDKYPCPLISTCPERQIIVAG